MKIKLSLLILFTTYLSSQENLKNFMAPEGNILIGADLHTHTVFQMVWYGQVLELKKPKEKALS